MNRVASFAYGILCYAAFLAAFLYLVGFLANIGVPSSIDFGRAASTGWALFINSLLLLLFGLQHSVMARPGFKAWITRFVPRQLERSTYLLASSVALALLFWQWRPLPEALYALQDPTARTLLQGLFFAGVGLVLYSTFLIDHFDLFGLRQAFLYLRRQEYTEKRFVTPHLYKFIRHPLYVGWILVFWATPDMSAGHLLFALGMTGYILVAIPFEERDLGAALGEEYERYRASTPMFLPRFGGRGRA